MSKGTLQALTVASVASLTSLQARAPLTPTPGPRGEWEEEGTEEGEDNVLSGPCLNIKSCRLMRM